MVGLRAIRSEVEQGRVIPHKAENAAKGRHRCN
jgi:hypothetical protein